jgi:RND family efflux transporter MFP subunit
MAMTAKMCGAGRRARAAAIIGLFGLTAGCSETNKYVEPPPPEVTVTQPVRREVTNYFEVTGTAQPLLSVDIRARVKGFLKERLFREGMLVKAGQLLLVIDEEPFRVHFEQAKARLAEAEASLRKSKESRSREVARAQLALDDSQLQLAILAETRQRNLTMRNAGSREELDTVEANRKKTQAQVQSSRAALEQAEADYLTNILGYEANFASLKTAVRNAEIELGYCRMYAPIDGRISRVNLHVGNLVGEGQSSLLATIVKIDSIHAYVNVSEYDLLRYRSNSDSPGQVVAGPESMPMELGLANERGYPHRGHGDYQDPAVDPGTGTIRVRGVFPNADGSILPGMFVRIRVPYERRKDALLVPERALATDQSGAYLLVVGQGDLIEYRPVKAGGIQLDGLRVVEGRIGPEDRVVVDGLLRARPKLKVNPKSETVAANAVPVADAGPKAERQSRP